MDQADAIGAFSALAHEHRLAVYRLLIEAGHQGLSAGNIAAALDIPPSSLTAEKEEPRMKRLHIHVSVDDLEESTRFYAALFAAEPTVSKSDYVKWMLDDPRVNFAISARGRKGGIEHLGIQAEDEAELGVIFDRLAKADRPTLNEENTTCCYARSEKQWVADPQGVI